MRLTKFTTNQNCVNGLNYGKEITYRNGLIAVQINHKSLLQECIFYDHCLILLKCNMHNYTMCGLITYYHPNGIIFMKCNNNRYGQRHGREITYYSNGLIKSECDYANGKKHGINKMYELNGDIWYEDEWVNGEKI